MTPQTDTSAGGATLRRTYHRKVPAFTTPGSPPEIWFDELDPARHRGFIDRYRGPSPFDEGASYILIRDRGVTLGIAVLPPSGTLYLRLQPRGAKLEELILNELRAWLVGESA